MLGCYYPSYILASRKVVGNIQNSQENQDSKNKQKPKRKIEGPDKISVPNDGVSLATLG